MKWNGLWRRGKGTTNDPDNGRLIFKLTGINAYLYARRSDNKMATLRTLYWWIIRRYETELCQHCGGPVRIVYHAPDEIWEAVTGNVRYPDGEAHTIKELIDYIKQIHQVL